MDPGDDSDPLTRRLVFLGKQLQRSFESLLAAHNCTLPTWSVLRYLTKHPDISQMQLAAGIGIESPTVTRHIDRLEAHGLVARQRDENDRRVIRLSLTPAGIELWQTLYTLADAHEARVTAALSPPQRRSLETAIRTLAIALEDQHAHA